MPNGRWQMRAEQHLPGLVAVVLAIGMTWPLVLHLGSEVGQDIYDPLYHALQVAWIGHALLHARPPR